MKRKLIGSGFEIDSLFPNMVNTKRDGNACMQVYLPKPLRCRQDATEGKSLSGVQYVWNQIFPSPRVVSVRKITVALIIY